jgi:hypothetical protein
MTSKVTASTTDVLRERLAEALRDSAPLRLSLGQALVAHRGMVRLDARQAEAIADAMLPVVGGHAAAVRAAALREAAGYARSRSVDEWGAAAACPSTVLCTVSDELYRMAALDGTGEAS